MSTGRPMNTVEDLMSTVEDLMSTVYWDQVTLDFPSGPMTVAVSVAGGCVVGVRFRLAGAGARAGVGAGPRAGAGVGASPRAGADPTWPGSVGLAGEDRDPRLPLIEEATRQLAAYAAGAREEFDLPLRFSGTEFQQAVWTALLDIPYGQTSSYGKVAANLGRPGSSRAVGAAVGANPIGIVVPCHRVIGADGSLTGFAGGLDNKVALLAREGSAAW